jgi:acetylornithine deacetylase/succinyl-diaminopimelate desuccinylase-like protein
MKTVTPREAHAKITCRLVPDQDPAEIVDLIARHVAKFCPPSARATIQRYPGGAHPAAIRRDHPALEPARRVLREMYCKEPLITRTGGTIPVAALFTRELGTEMVDFAWGMPDNQIHAPNESMRLEDLRRGMRGYCAYLTALAR